MLGAEWIGMDDQLLHELKALRARAYGPDSDIHDDPSALTRLQALEQLARGSAPGQLPPKPPKPPVPPLPAMSARVPEPAVDAEPVAPIESAPEGDGEVPAEHPVLRRAWTKKRVVIAWGASLAIAVLVTATVTGLVSRRIQADPREIAVLGVDTFAEWPGIFANYTENGTREPADVPEGGAAFQTFHGLSFFKMRNGMFAYAPDQACLMVVDSSKIDSESNSFEGAIFSGCAAGTFPATVEIIVTSGPQQLPDELLGAFPEGTALQFVLGGDEVVVLSDHD